MDLKEIAAVSGKSGLFKILKPTRTGVVLESLDDAKNKTIINSNTKVSVLKDISMYTLTGEGNMPLAEIFLKVKELYNEGLPVSAKSTEKELRDFFLTVVPDYDSEKVYASDIKKLVVWFQILQTNYPEIFDKQDEVESIVETTSVDNNEQLPAKKTKKEATIVGVEAAEEVAVVKKESKPKKVKAS